MKTASQELKVQRLKSRYPELFPLNLKAETKKEVLEKIKNTLKEYDLNNNTIIVSSKDILKPTILFSFISLRRFVRYKFMNAYRLLDIYLSNDEDYESISQIRAEFIVLYLGYAEFENKRQSDIIEQIIEQQYVRGGKVWIFYKGSYSKFRGKYPRLYELIQDRNFNQIEINLGNVEIRRETPSSSISEDKKVIGKEITEADEF